MPTAEVLAFVGNDGNWRLGRAIMSLPERVEKIKTSQAEFAGAGSNLELIELLSANRNKAMIYYLLHGGEDRFNLINNYSFERFWEMISLIGNPSFASEAGLTPLKVHLGPLRAFKKSLEASGLAGEEADAIIDNLRAGRFPLSTAGRASAVASFEVSESSAIKNANSEIGRVLGREQFGASLLFPLYREYLSADGSEAAEDFLSQMAEAATFTQRLELINKIEQAFADFRERAKKDLQPNWLKFGEKMVTELSLDQVLGEAEAPIKGEELLPRLDAKRIDLRRIKKELLVLLKGENLALKDLGQQILKKRKARQSLLAGLEHQTEEVKKKELMSKIAAIEADLAELERQRKILGEARADDRFAHLSAEEKKAEIEKLGQEIAALTEKSPSAIFIYIAMQVLGEERLRESDINLLREMESHLQGPFQNISDHLNYDRGRRQETKRVAVRLEYLDKTKRLMNMVRFADSKICCFSSCNYEMIVQHETKNKFWVASINADPMSFVISIENADTGNEDTGLRENLGFIFGSFGTDQDGRLAVMLNGIYYAPGVENETQVAAILSAVEEIFDGLPVKTMAVASQYGGGAVGEKLPAAYSNAPVELTRLRALDDGGGDPETKIYDDLGTGSDLNRPHYYGDNVWHKNY